MRFNRPFVKRRVWQYLLHSSLVLAQPALSAEDEDYSTARKIHDRIAGVPPNAAVLEEMAELISNGDREGAAYIAMKAPQFFNLNLKHWFSSWTNEAQNTDVPLNDYTATLIGIVRDDVSFDKALYDDILYTGGAAAGVTAYSPADNSHYADLETNRVDLSTSLVRQSSSALTGLGENPGIMSTRAFGEAYFLDGTNRSPVRFLFVNYLCRDVEELHDTTIPDLHIRQDVERSPGGDSKVFRNKCAGCHAGLDPLAGAFAYYNFEDGQTVYTPSQVQSKYFNNNENFPEGYVTESDSWKNLWTQGLNADLGWAGEQDGRGAVSFGQLLTKTKAFPNCMAKRVYKKLCFNDINENSHPELVEELSSTFKDSNFNMKALFAKTAAKCINEK